jgi:hypothetical protein
MKIPLLTQAVKVFIAGTMYSVKKVKESLTPLQKVKKDSAEKISTPDINNSINK